MSPLAQFDQELEKIIRELTQRILAPRLREFDGVWEAANKICDRYEITKKAIEAACQAIHQYRVQKGQILSAGSLTRHCELPPG
jgi:hypothetical protein